MKRAVSGAVTRDTAVIAWPLLAAFQATWHALNPILRPRGFVITRQAIGVGLLLWLVSPWVYHEWWDHSEPIGKRPQLGTDNVAPSKRLPKETLPNSKNMRTTCHKAQLWYYYGVLQCRWITSCSLIHSQPLTVLNPSLTWQNSSTNKHDKRPLQAAADKITRPTSKQNPYKG